MRDASSPSSVFREFLQHIFFLLQVFAVTLRTSQGCVSAPPKFGYLFLLRYACHGLCLSLCWETRIPLAYSACSERGGCTRDILMTLLLTDLRTADARSVSHTERPTKTFPFCIFQKRQQTDVPISLA